MERHKKIRSIQNNKIKNMQYSPKCTVLHEMLLETTPVQIQSIKEKVNVNKETKIQKKKEHIFTHLM